MIETTQPNTTQPIATQPNTTPFQTTQSSVTPTVEASKPATSTSTEKKALRTIYDASAAEVFWKNFLAGVGRGLGSIIIYLIFVSVMGMLAIQFVWPMIEPYAKLYQSSMQSLQSIQALMPEGLGMGDAATSAAGDVNGVGGAKNFSPSTEVSLEQLPQGVQDLINENLNQYMQQAQPPQGE